MGRSLNSTPSILGGAERSGRTENEEKPPRGMAKVIFFLPDVLMGEGSRRRSSSVCLATRQDLMRVLLVVRERQRPPSKMEVLAVLERSEAFLRTLPNFPTLDTSQDVTVVGDLHGHVGYLLDIFALRGNPSDTNPYVFNGDLIDRGETSVEVFSILLLYRLLYPDHVHINRGNHETETISSMYGFKEEVRGRYGMDVYHKFLGVFRALPLGCLVNQQVLIVHAGIPRGGDTLRKLSGMNRFREPEEDRRLHEILWSDPREQDGWRLDWTRPEFGPDVTRRFVTENDLVFVIRSHSDVENGYQCDHDGLLHTVNSAPVHHRTLFSRTRVQRAAVLVVDPSFHVTPLSFPHVTGT